MAIGCSSTQCTPLKSFVPLRCEPQNFLKPSRVLTCRHISLLGAVQGLKDVLRQSCSFVRETCEVATVYPTLHPHPLIRWVHARWGFDLASGYKHKPLPPNSASMSLDELRKGGYLMDETQWLRVRSISGYGYEPD